MKKFLTKVLSLALVVFSLFSMTACKKEVFVGFDTDLAKALGEELGLTVKFVEINWDLKESLLDGNDVDLVWNGFTYTEDRDNGYYDTKREQQIGGLDFSNFYMENKQVAVVKKSELANYTSNASFAGKVGCAETASAGATVIEDILKSTPSTLQKQIDTFTAVLAGTFDYAVIDSSMASVYIQAENGAYKDSLAVVDIEGVNNSSFNVNKVFSLIKFTKSFSLDKRTSCFEG
jgi:polar amino acid transport system substrate-binding protein